MLITGLDQEIIEIRPADYYAVMWKLIIFILILEENFETILLSFIKLNT